MLGCMRSLLSGIADLIAPPRCAGCDAPGASLCPECVASLPRIAAEHSCPACGAPFGLLTCTECWDRELAFEAAVCVGEFEWPLARAVVLHKDSGERRLSAVFGDLLASAVAEAWPGWLPPDAVAYVPATDKALRRRGFDHARAIAQALARAADAPLIHALGRGPAADQRTLGRTARAANATGSVVTLTQVAGRILLVDDVMTTGATLDAAASALISAGAESVRCAAIARTW